MLKVAIAQIAPVLLDRTATLLKVIARIDEAAAHQCGLVCFGETLVPAYPLWLSRTGGARFDDADQKALHALYAEQAVSIENGDLDDVCQAAKRGGIAVVIGVAERPASRGGHTLYCTCVVIDASGQIASTHRKLMPTYEERLAWGIGDAAGLVTHALGSFRMGALNCWENWMPLARAALYAGGEDLHVAIWPGCERLTRDITRFIAAESRSFVISASGLIREQDIPAGVPLREQMAEAGEVIYDGGSCIAGPEGEFLVEPQVGKETLIMVDLDPAHVARARQNFDPVGHYARPDLLQLSVDRRRPHAQFIDDALR